MKQGLAIGALLGLVLSAAVHIISLHALLRECRADAREAQGAAAIVREYRSWLQVAASRDGHPAGVGGP